MAPFLDETMFYRKREPSSVHPKTNGRLFSDAGAVHESDGDQERKSRAEWIAEAEREKAGSGQSGAEGAEGAPGLGRKMTLGELLVPDRGATAEEQEREPQTERKLSAERGQQPVDRKPALRPGLTEELIEELIDELANEFQQELEAFETTLDQPQPA